jgi:hypothetical protein
VLASEVDAILKSTLLGAAMAGVAVNNKKPTSTKVSFFMRYSHLALLKQSLSPTHQLFDLEEF